VRAAEVPTVLVWVRDAVLTGDSTARGRVGFWQRGHASSYICDAVRRGRVWAPGSCTLEWET